MRLIAILGLLLWLLPGCAGPDLTAFANRMTTPEERVFAENYLRLLSGGQLDSAAALLAPSLKSDSAVRTLQEVSSLLRGAHLDSLHVIGVNINRNVGTKTREVNLSYEAPTGNGGWLTTNVATRSAQGSTSVIGVSAHLVPGRLEDLNAFTLAHKSIANYLWLALAALMPVITIGTAVRLITAKGMPRRWPWAFVALIASPAFILNWTSGQAAMANSLFVLFGAAFTRSGAAAPWSITFAIPVGALVAYLRLRAWRNAQRARV
jgi:hypothetical protein